jgi:hypothetical protein
MRLYQGSVEVNRRKLSTGGVWIFEKAVSILEKYFYISALRLLNNSKSMTHAKTQSRKMI